MSLAFSGARLHSGRQALLVIVGLALAIPLGIASSVAPQAVWGVAAIELFGVGLVAGSWVIPLGGIAGAFVPTRIGPGALISVSDAAVVVGAVVSILYIDWNNNPALRKPLLGLVAYMATLVVVTIHAPSTAGAVEILHRSAIVAGGLMVGAYLTQTGRGELAIKVLLGLATALGVGAGLYSAAHHFSPAYPFDLQKNYVGSVLCSSALLSLALRPGTPAGKFTLRACQALLLMGLVAAQSRGAIFGLLIGGLAWSFLMKRSRTILVALILAAIPVAINSIQTELLANPNFGSVATHIVSAGEAVNAWLESPILGQGLRSFAVGTTRVIVDPHNVILLTLAESGVVALVGLFVLLGNTLYALRQKGTVLAYVALAVVVSRFAHGLFDVYWVHGSQALPWIIAGLALGQVATAPQPARELTVSSTAAS